MEQVTPMQVDPAGAMTGWADGWSRSRRTPRPERIGSLLRIQVDAAAESVRWLLPEPTPEALADLLDRHHPAHTGVKVMGDPAQWEPLFGPGWVADIAVWLMRRDLEARDVPPLPGGYRIERADADDCVGLQVGSPDGEPAARGQIGLGERYAVPDRIVTEPDHQRRGLGSVVMATLENLAVERGLVRAVLGATDDGRALYRHLGWSEVGPRTGMYWRPEGV